MELLQIWQSLSKSLFDSYRPELHYMRGPGPKWREKHAHRPTPARPMHRVFAAYERPDAGSLR
jgi:hypothetical protein